MASCFGCVIRVLAGWLQVAGAQRANRMYTHGLGEEVHVGEIGRFPQRPRGSEVSLVELRWDCVSGPVCKKRTPSLGVSPFEACTAEKSLSAVRWFSKSAMLRLPADLLTTSDLLRSSLPEFMDLKVFGKTI